VIADGVALESMFGQGFLFARDVAGISQRLAYFEVVAPAGESQAIVAKTLSVCTILQRANQPIDQ
jgi:hypothetical protein